ncbi:MAG TPA: class I SAM-dependent methyltransferase [Chitinophagaceae bacterium]|nr:class I SAM-dependent methyltransferase [Chitinophagaceae bacterium]
MKRSPANFQEKAAAAAFSKQAPLFDRLYQTDAIIQYKRKRVRDHVEQFLRPGSSMLELNAGTGEDALYFAKQGYKVHATDIAEGMMEQLQRKINEQGLDDKVSTETCSFTELENLAQQGPYDYIFSNFAGLNCTGRLEKVLDSLNWLAKPGGYVTLVILPRFCLWEFLLLFKGKFKTAFRRFAGRKGARAHIEGEYFRCWYYNPSFIRRHLKDSFEPIALEGLCSIVPPSYIENFASKHPRIYDSLVRSENKWKARWPFKLVGDYYIITLRKKGEPAIE